MGTRGLVGFIQDGEMKAAYRHFDSYPEAGGQDVVDAIEEMKEMGWDKIKEAVKNLTLIKEDEDPSPELIEKAQEMNLIDTSVGKQSEEDVYCVLREAQGQLLNYLAVGFMPDDKEFLKDTLFCEYAYLVDLDTHELRIHYGHPERHIMTFPLDEIPEDWIEVFNKSAEMNSQ